MASCGVPCCHEPVSACTQGVQEATPAPFHPQVWDRELGEKDVAFAGQERKAWDAPREPKAAKKGPRVASAAETVRRQPCHLAPPRISSRHLAPRRTHRSPFGPRTTPPLPPPPLQDRLSKNALMKTAREEATVRRRAFLEPHRAVLTRFGAKLPPAKSGGPGIAQAMPRPTPRPTPCLTPRPMPHAPRPTPHATHALPRRGAREARGCWELADRAHRHSVGGRDADAAKPDQDRDARLPTARAALARGTS